VVTHSNFPRLLPMVTSNLQISIFRFMRQFQEFGFDGFQPPRHGRWPALVLVRMGANGSCALPLLGVFLQCSTSSKDASSARCNQITVIALVAHY
jgi:hypothetical protein